MAARMRATLSWFHISATGLIARDISSASSRRSLPYVRAASMRFLRAIRAARFTLARHGHFILRHAGDDYSMAWRAPERSVAAPPFGADGPMNTMPTSRPSADIALMRLKARRACE